MRVNTGSRASKAHMTSNVQDRMLPFALPLPRTLQSKGVAYEPHAQLICSKRTWRMHTGVHFMYDVRVHTKTIHTQLLNYIHNFEDDVDRLQYTYLCIGLSRYY